jgi:RNA polymerase sigma factor (sigma-70 family)
MALLETDLLHVFLGARQELQRFFVRRVQCADTAADLVQEVYLKLPHLHPSPCSELAVRAWLFRVASNLAVDHARREKRHGELLEAYFPEDGDSGSAPAPDHLALAHEQLGQIQAALAALPENCAEVLYLSRVEGLSHAEIAEKLGISKSWVEKLLLRALSQCRRAVARHV